MKADVVIFVFKYSNPERVHKYGFVFKKDSEKDYYISGSRKIFGEPTEILTLRGYDLDQDRDGLTPFLGFGR